MNFNTQMECYAHFSVLQYYKCNKKYYLKELIMIIFTSPENAEV